MKFPAVESLLTKKKKIEKIKFIPIFDSGIILKCQNNVFAITIKLTINLLISINIIQNFTL